MERMRPSDASTEETRPGPVHMSDARAPVDGGWGWMCVLSSFLVHVLIVGGVAKSFGILFVEIVERFNVTSEATAWIIAIMQCLAMMMAPLSNGLAERYTSRAVVFTGGVIVTASFILSAFASSLWMLYLSYGVLAGIGVGLSYAPSIVIVGQYFDKRRALTNGISVAGSGIGTFCIPPLMRCLLDEYGMQGALLILSGVVAHLTVCGALQRPRSTYSKERKQDNITCASATVEYQGTSKSDVLCSNSVADGDELNTNKEEKTTKNNISVGQNQTVDLQFGLNDLEDGKSTESRQSHRTKCWQSDCFKKKSNNLQSKSKPVLELALLKNTIFWVFTLSTFLAFLGYPNVFVLVPAHGELLGFTKNESAFLVSIIGITDVIGRIAFGWFADLNLVKKKYIFMSSMGASGIVYCVCPFVRSYVGLAVLCGATGLLSGSFVALIAVILAETLGVQQLPSAFGLNVLFLGVSVLIGGPILGMLRDRTGSWTASFFFCGVSTVLGSLLVLLEPMATRWEQREKTAKQQASILANLEIRPLNQCVS